jgi:hypothetical protein
VILRNEVLGGWVDNVSAMLVYFGPEVQGSAAITRKTKVEVFNG